MIKQLEYEALSAELATLDELLGNLSPDDFAGKVGFEERREEVARELSTVSASSDNLAAAALMFGGAPVVGSKGIDSEFAARALNDFKSFVDVLWASSDNQVVMSRGPIRDHGAAKLYVTEMVRGSVGFVIEEIDPKGQVLFPSSLKVATDRATELIEAFVKEDPAAFTAELEALSPRVFTSLRSLFTGLHRAEATVRIVEGAKDIRLDREAVDRAYVRIEESSVTEDDIQMEGTLLGVLPEAGRFEFTSLSGQFMSGRVAETFAESYLKRLREEQFAGKTWKASFHRKETRQFQKRTSSYTLFDLTELEN